MATRKSNGNRPTDEQLLDSALRTFSRLGYHGATMSTIAEDAEATKPTLYAHFGDKEALYLRLYNRESERVRNILFRAYEDASSLSIHDEVSTDMREFFTYAREHPESFRFLFSESARPEGAEAVRRNTVREIEERIAQQIRLRRTRYAEPPAPETLGVEILASLLVGIAFLGGRIVIETGLAPEALGALAVGLVTDGLIRLDPDLVDDLNSASGVPFEPLARPSRLRRTK